MSWDVAIFADLKFPPGGRDAWMALVADERAFSDWEGDFTGETAPKNNVARPVAKVIAAIESAGEEFFRFDASSDHVALRAMFPKDPYLDWCTPLATIFRVAAQAGGEGEIYFVGYMTIQFAYRFRIGAGTSSFEKLDDEAADQAESLAGFVEVDEMVQDRVREMMSAGGEFPS